MIKYLPDEVKAQLRSGIAICSLQQCVEELVLNSIDASATCVAVKVDVEAWKLQVVDNGLGIDRDDFDRVGNRYNTSKCSCLEDLENLRFYGFRGEAMASIVALSGLVEISSRTKLSTKTFVKVFNSGQSVSVCEAETTRPSAGTTVTICNFFCNMPVRKKRLDPVLEMERIRQRIEAISLMHPSVSFTMKKECTGAVLVQLSKVKSVYYRFAQIHGLGKAQKLCEVKHSYGQFEITGHMGREGHHNNDIQFLFLNRRLILKTCIHKLLKCILSKCATFTKQSSSPIAQVASSPKERAGAELHGMYVININCSYSEYDVCLEPAKTLIEFKDWDSLLYCMEEGVKTFLKRESLLQIMPEPEASLDCLIPPVFCQQSDFSDIGSLNQIACSDLVRGKTLASKSVLRRVAVDFTEMSRGSKPCNKDTTECEMDTKVEVAIATKLDQTFEPTSSHAVNTASLNHSNLQDMQCNVSNSVSNCENTINDSVAHFDHEYKVLDDNFRESKANKVNGTEITNSSRSVIGTVQHSSLKRESSQICRQHFTDDIEPLIPDVTPSHKLAVSHVASPLSKFRRMSGELDVCNNHMTFVSETALAVKQDTHVANLSFHERKQHKTDNSLTFVNSVSKLHTYSGCRLNNRRKVSVATKLSNLKQANIESCDSTTENVLNIIRHGDLSNGKQLAHSSIQNMDYGEQVLDNTPLCPILPNCEEDSPSTLRHDCKSSENPDLSYSLLRPCHTGSLSNTTNFSTSAPPTTLVELNHIDMRIPSTISLTDELKSSDTLLPRAGNSKGFHTDESQQRNEQSPTSDNWLAHYDSFAGKMVYINKVTGLSKYDTPSEEETKVPCMSDVTNMAVSVIQRGVDAETTDGLSRLFSTWKNPVFIQPLDVALNVTSGVAEHLPVPVHNIMLPYRFTKDMITSMKVIHQVDKKFLACLVNTGNQSMCFNNNPKVNVANLLVLVDQHAAHERVRLEGLVAESYQDDPLQLGQKKLCSSVVSPPLEVDVRQEDLRLLKSCEPLLSSLGLDMEFPHSDKPCVLLRKVPACFLERESTSLLRGRDSVVKSLAEEYLREQIKSLRSTRRPQSTLPLTVHNVLASQACHGAIKFNHSLSQEECRSLVRSLAACQLPFQCAHGRPSITPVVDLQYLDNDQMDTSKPNLRKLRRMYDAWRIYGM
ncbi:DNA mismatch repair protein Mlh3 isoform X2 [Sardina pilchardus]|uniref:DNA mismatch repair protein Mlh3 isoform X2 n=1 Tax=Sardina pilchardus TaxID=27697 RepID=UPI002E13A0E3